MANAPLSPTAQKVLELLQKNAGTSYTATDVCEAIDCVTSQAQTALDTLARAGLITRDLSVGGGATYVAGK
jgi:DNA-binding IclR family transcriptional regulator